MKFVFFTKTPWAEPPRLRHQVARLLAAHGHDVLFFQKPTLRGGGIEHPEPHIETRTLRYLLHWQLRANRVMSRANALVEKREIVRAVPPELGLPIVNFNFDYEFLRELYPTHPIVTIINDDFVTSARPWARRESLRTLGATASSSDANFVVSYPLRDQLLPFTDKVELFFPWARVPYRRPSANGARRDLLYWGYINDRADAELVVGLLDAGRRVHFVGPVADSPRVRTMSEHRNAVMHGPAAITAIADVLAQCCASIAPYDVSYRYVAAATVSNRTFDLLAAGLPMIFSDLPALLEAPRGVLYRCRNVAEFVAAADEAELTFHDVQPVIENFLAAHTPELRYRQLMRHFEGVV